MDKSNPRVIVWHYEAAAEGQICPSAPHTFFVPTLESIKILVQTQMTGTSVVFSLLEGEMSRIWYQNDQ